MRRSRQEAKAPVRAAVVSLPEVDPSLRDEHDDDPLIEEMVERLRTHLSDMVALDEWGRPVPWRNVLRVAVGPILGRLRDAETSVALGQRVIELPADADADADADARANGAQEPEIFRRSAEAVGWPDISSLGTSRSGHGSSGSARDG